MSRRAWILLLLATGAGIGAGIGYVLSVPLHGFSPATSALAGAFVGVWLVTLAVGTE